MHPLYSRLLSHLHVLYKEYNSRIESNKAYNTGILRQMFPLKSSGPLS